MLEALDNISGTFPDTLGGISEYIFTSKYARYLPTQQRRETWDEAVNRVEEMHLNKFSNLSGVDKAAIIDAFNMVREKLIVPSMRSMQFGGIAVEAHNARMYNCAVRHIDSIRAFSEAFYLLLCGCGVGFGLSYKYLNRLPNLVGPNDKTGTVTTYVVEDNIEGWADSVEALLNCYFINTAYSGRKIIFDYSKIRKKGTPLKTGGGKAPGYMGLKAAHIKIKRLLDHIIENNEQKRLLSVDAMDILLHEADAVLSGGIRRSACSIMFDKDDEDMLMAKTGDWYAINPQRARSNNSVIIRRDDVSFEEFASIVQRTREWGEPGFVFADSSDILYNPCFEVSFIPVDDGVCGVQFCNLTSINGSKVTSFEEFERAAEAATLIGTLQATYTHFPYLSNAAKKLTEDESLLGVSITAMMDNPDILLGADYQQKAAKIVVDTNKLWAEKLGINQSARTTVIKPEGTSTLALGSMSSGIHPSHSRYMFRRVQANKLDNVYQFFKQYNPDFCEESVWSANETDDVISFPIKVKDTAMVKSDLTALEHLDIIKSTQQNWVLPGTTEVNTKPIHHNVSCTVIVQDDEWEAVTKYLYDNRGYFAAVSLLGSNGDKDYAQAPMEAVKTPEDIERFMHLMNNFLPLDYTLMVESEDGTSLMQETSCAGNGCEVK